MVREVTTSRARFYCGTHEPHWLGRAPIPWCVSYRRFTRRPYRVNVRALAPWGLDSGGFTELRDRGRWTLSAAEYAAGAERLRVDVGMMAWAAPQDWMTEPFIIARTGLDVATHQARTIASVLELVDLAPAVPWIPVLQGQTVDDYLHHVDAYARAGIDLTRAPLVGLGSICRRGHTAEIVGLVDQLADVGIRLHAFGAKSTALPRIGARIASADSTAWSYNARRNGRNRNGLDVAVTWAARMTRTLGRAEPAKHLLEG